MKKFVWPLQKVLDVRETQEQQLRAKLFELTEEALKVRQRIMLCDMRIKSAAANINELDTQSRMLQQPMFLQYADATKKEIKKHEQVLVEIEKKRAAKEQETIQIRKMRKGLEKLKENASDEYLTEQNRLEQIELDDITNTASVRKNFGVTI